MPRDFWISHLVVPVAFVAVALTGIWVFHWDDRIARAFFYTGQPPRWIGSGEGSWWAREIIHTGGRNVVRAIAAAALVVWVVSLRVPRLQPWRRPTGYVALSMIVATTLVGALKSVTNVDCPWDLVDFGGTRPHVGIFADRPDDLPAAKCFPGAHSASGFALLCFYYVFRDRPGRARWWALAAGLTVGGIFAFGQEARGAHFLSHDLAGAGVVWVVVTLLYSWIAKRASRPPAPA